eukprot:jgi/Bigna1/141218/aug1.61_g15926
MDILNLTLEDGLMCLQDGRESKVSDSSESYPGAWKGGGGVISEDTNQDASFGDRLEKGHFPAPLTPPPPEPQFQPQRLNLLLQPTLPSPRLAADPKKGVSSKSTGIAQAVKGEGGMEKELTSRKIIISKRRQSCASSVSKSLPIFSCRREHMKANLARKSLFGRTVKTEPLLANFVLPFFPSSLAAVPRRGYGSGRGDSLCACCIAEGVWRMAVSSEKKGRGQLCKQHIADLERRNMVFGRRCLIRRKTPRPGSGKIFELISPRTKLHKRLTFACGLTQVNMIRVYISPKSAKGFPHLNELYVLYPRDLKHYDDLARSRSFMPLTGIDSPALAFTASCGRLSMFGFFGRAATRPGAVTTALHRIDKINDVTTASTFASMKANPDCRDDNELAEAKNRVLAQHLNVSNDHIASAKKSPLFLEAAKKVRFVHMENNSLWFQLPVTKSEYKMLLKFGCRKDSKPFAEKSGFATPHQLNNSASKIVGKRKQSPQSQSQPQAPSCKRSRAV